MYWYAAEPIVAANAESAMRLLGKTKIRQVREFIVRRLAAK